MLSALFTLLGALGGGALRLLPEFLEAFRNFSQRENAVKLAELDLQKTAAELANKLEIAKLGAENITAEAEAALTRAKAEMMVADHAAQSQLTGVKWADALNVSVRPVTTFLMLALFIIFKFVVLLDAWRQTATVTSLVPVIWNDDDAAMFAGIMVFWFTDSVLLKKKR